MNIDEEIRKEANELDSFFRNNNIHFKTLVIKAIKKGIEIERKRIEEEDKIECEIRENIDVIDKYP